MSYKYILISTDVDWRSMSWEKPRKAGEVSYFSDLPFEGNIFLQKLMKFFYSWRINKSGVRVPFRKICYRGIVRAFHLNSEDCVKIIFYDRSRASYDFEFLKYLRKEIPGVKIGYLFSDIVDKSGAKIFDIVEKLNQHYDKVFSFDKNDAQKYGFDYSYLIYDRDIKTNLEIQSDVFLAAKAKDRLIDLLNVYDMCAKEQLRMDFTINEISEKDVHLVEDRNVHANTILSYQAVVEKILKTKCIIDVMQKGSVGITLNIVEAVCFNKKAISNNAELINEPFYDSSRILILDQNTEKIKTFLDAPMKPYSKEDKHLFSGTYLFERL